MSGCVDCVGEGGATHSRFSMPLAKLGEKKYYIGMFFKVTPHYCLKYILTPTWQLSLTQANWFKAEQYCRFHGMHLASINSEQEQKNLQEHIQSFGEWDLRVLCSFFVATYLWIVLAALSYYPHTNHQSSATSFKIVRDASCPCSTFSSSIEQTHLKLVNGHLSVLCYQRQL